MGYQLAGFPYHINYHVRTNEITSVDTQFDYGLGTPGGGLPGFLILHLTIVPRGYILLTWCSLRGIVQVSIESAPIDFLISRVDLVKQLQIERPNVWHCLFNPARNNREPLVITRHRIDASDQ